MTTEFDAEEVAYWLVFEYLETGPDYYDISNAVLDNGGSVDQVEEVSKHVQGRLSELKGAM